ncbi:MAG: HU family DNA-binding protein [Bacteroidaceae bacterium]|nr:HU family DNA-binding protein [Bacteroidaceae bacterium]
MEKLNQTQLSELFASESGMSRAAAEQFVKSFFDIIADKVISDGLVKVKGLGTFKLLQMEDRESVNVNTGERFTIAGHQKISFTPDAVLKETLNRPFSAFETVILSDEQAAALEAMEEGGAAVVETVTELPEESAAPVGEPAAAPVEEPAAAPVEEPAAAPVEEPAAATVGEPAAGSAAAEPAGQVREITQSRGKRITLKLLVWIISIALVLGLAYVLFWPVIGSRLLAVMDHNTVRTDAAGIEVPEIEPVAAIPDTAVTMPVTVTETQQETQQATASAPEAAPAAAGEPAERKPSVPETHPAAAATASVQQAFRLNQADDARDLSEFTAADTVSYRMTGTLGRHVIEKGETLTIIAKHTYGTKKLWPYLAAYNHLDSSKSLKVGAVILIPKLEHK